MVCPGGVPPWGCCESSGKWFHNHLGFQPWRTPARHEEWIFSFFCFEGTVRPDWICMRVVSLESPLKGHQPLQVLNFFILLLNILKDFKVLSLFMQNWIQSSCLFGSRFAYAQAAIFFAKPYSINAGEASIVLWVAACIHHSAIHT